MNSHHLILGELRDLISGKMLKDTHDERYRQKLARLLIENKGYFKTDITPRCEVIARAGQEKSARLKVDFKISLGGRTCMMIKYGPGSLVTRRRPALAVARLLETYQIPLVVVTNGEDAGILAGATGKIISTGLTGVSTRTELERLISIASFDCITQKRAEMESRILYAFEVDGSCLCDDSIQRAV